jgi:hypothetical protein
MAREKGFASTFDKAVAESFLVAMRNNTAIPCPEGGWSSEVMPTLGGLVLLSLLGPEILGQRKTVLEHAQARVATREQDVFAAFSFCQIALMMMLMLPYDDYFAPIVECRVGIKDSGERWIVDISGIRKLPSNFE